MNRTYPAIMKEEESGMVAVSFPDLAGVYTCGNDLDDAMVNASEAAGLFLISALVDGEKIPEASKIEDVKLEEGEIATYVVADMNDTENMKNKTLTIPAWLDTVAQKRKINFSGTLREALIQKLT